MSEKPDAKPDEAAMIPALEEAWQQAIRPTLTDFQGSAWFLSTPKGMNYFKRLFDRGQDPEREDWASWQMPTGANPYIEPGEIESARLDLTEAAFNQEYSALFVNWEGSVFRRVGEAATASALWKSATSSSISTLSGCGTYSIRSCRMPWRNTPQTSRVLAGSVFQ